MVSETKTKHLIITGILVSLPLSAGLQANCKGLNAQQADLRDMLMKARTVAASINALTHKAEDRGVVEQAAIAIIEQRKAEIAKAELDKCMGK